MSGKNPTRAGGDILPLAFAIDEDEAEAFGTGEGLEGGLEHPPFVVDVRLGGVASEVVPGSGVLVEFECGFSDFDPEFAVEQMGERSGHGRRRQQFCRERGAEDVRDRGTHQRFGGV